MCNLKAALRKAQQIVKKHNDAARKVWNIAHRQMCIFNNIDAKDCKVVSVGMHLILACVHHCHEGC